MAHLQLIQLIQSLNFNCNDVLTKTREALAGECRLELGSSNSSIKYFTSQLRYEIN